VISILSLEAQRELYATYPMPAKTKVVPIWCYTIVLPGAKGESNIAVAWLKTDKSLHVLIKKKPRGLFSKQKIAFT